MVTDPTTLAVYAALAEMAYRRDSLNDQALSISDIDAITSLNSTVQLPDSAKPVFVTGPDFQNLGNLLTDGIYYYSERGFVGTIVRVGDKFVVIFRGTDTTLSGWSSVVAVATGNDTTPDGSIIDLQDSDSNKRLGEGTTGVSQWDDARALTEKAIQLAIDAGFTKDAVVVVGQSLGGGLVGLASAILGVEGHAIAPAPFENQLKIEAWLQATKSLITDNAGIFLDTFFLLPPTEQHKALQNLIYMNGDIAGAILIKS